MRKSGHPNPIDDARRRHRQAVDGAIGGSSAQHPLGSVEGAADAGLVETEAEAPEHVAQNGHG